MKYRKVKDDTKNRCDVERNGNCIKKMSKENYLFICLYGVRYKGGVSFIRGHIWNKGMLYADIKEKQQVKDLQANYQCGIQLRTKS